MYIYCREVESTRNSKLRQLSGRFQTLIWRPGDTVQNLESPGLSGRVDSPAQMTMCVNQEESERKKEKKQQAEKSLSMLQGGAVQIFLASALHQKQRFQPSRFDVLPPALPTFSRFSQFIMKF